MSLHISNGSCGFVACWRIHAEADDQAVKEGIAYSVLAHLVNRLPRPPEANGLPHIGFAVEIAFVIHFRSGANSFWT